MIDKMIAGAMDGMADGVSPSGHGIAGRGAGDAKAVPGERHTLINKDAGKDGKKPSSVADKAHGDRPRVAKGAKASGGHALEHDAEAPEGETTVQSHSRETLAANLEGKNAERVADAADAREASSSAPRAGKKPANGRLATDGMEGAIPAGMLLARGGTFAPSNAQKAQGSIESGADQTQGIKGAKAGRGEKKAVITVRDERTADNSLPAGDSPFAKTVKLNGDGSADMTLAIRGADDTKGSLAGQESRIAEKRDGDGQSFASMLSQELKSNAADIVKTGAIVLRDNNAGTIKLTLHPESLGDVKISLELSGDRKISGKIVVSSEEAYEAFNENMSGLSDAFVEGGFESAGFDLSFAGESGSGAGNREAAGNKSSPFYASSIPDVMSGVEPVDSIGDGYREAGLSAINVFA
jgi:flagellar hook-length control protein FliK